MANQSDTSQIAPSDGFDPEMSGVTGNAPSSLRRSVPGLRFLRSSRINKKIIVGVSMILIVVSLGFVGPFFVDLEKSDVASVLPDQSPNAQHWLGTQVEGRDMLAWLISSIPQTLRVGFLAGSLGVMLGAIIGFVAGYYGGFVDAILRNFTDIMLIVPGLLVLVVLTALVDVLTLEQMSIVIAAFAWMGAARVIRAQVLSLRERQYVEVAKMSGEKGLYIVFFELMPNMMPFILAAFVGAVIASVGTAIAQFFLGLGPVSLNTLGSILYWAQSYQAVVIGYWWWWGPPVAILVILFSGLFIASIGLDEWANPRLQERS